MKSLQAHLLVASPHLPDPNFYRTVVLMVQHNEQGALGLVLNRPSPNTLKEVWQQVSDQPCEHEQFVHVGGPLQGPLMAVHTEPSCSEDEIQPGVFFATQSDNLHHIVGQKEHPFRIFSGYSGWAGGQLEAELEVGGWLVTPAKYKYVFPPPGEDIWKQIIGDIGDGILRSSLGIEEPPDDPSVN